MYPMTNMNKTGSIATAVKTSVFNPIKLISLNLKL